MLTIAIVLILVFLLLLCAHTFTFTSKQPDVTPVTDITPDTEAPTRLSRAIQFKTISHQDPALFDEKAFHDLHAYLEKSFPLTHRTLSREKVGNSLLYTWNIPSPLPPLLLMAHLDVVPVEQGTEKDWTYPPFSGEIKEGYLWGRGTIDLKCGVLGLLEAVEYLLKKGFKPSRTIYLAFGHDEEVGGYNGARKIVELLASRGVTVDYVLDEGGSLTQGILPGISAPVAFVGIAEKGYISLELRVEGEGGHSSMPPQETAIGVLSQAIHALEKNPFPARIQGVIRTLFEYAGPEMPFARRLVFANLWLFHPIVRRKLEQSPETNAMIRTTTAPTIIEGGTKENVLPKTAKAVINFRILPGDTTKSVIDYVCTTINDKRVKVDVVREAWEPSAVSDLSSFLTIQETIRQVFPGTVVAPYLVAGATDSRHYAPLTKNIFKFVPVLLTRDDLKRPHGTNERVSLSGYEDCIRFYTELLCNSASPQGL